ncbi:MAG: DNA polymerase Y family protein [Deltaproteobacteria bacterium]|nr:DNA polymerase Y family protein [Deltaproteobacteria bacterium]MBI3388327.1 DNA polymerase Y family protein [Deltaproteobacteria bacterium]
MSRLACLFVPDFPLAAMLRSEPELRGEPVIVTDGSGPRATIVAMSAAAARRGITTGLSAGQAHAIFAALITRATSRDGRRAAQAALADVAYSFSPRVEEASDGEVYLDIVGSAALFDSEAKLAHMLAVRAEHVGLSAQVGVAGSKIAAYLAARNGGGVTVVPANEEWAYLAPLAVSLLAPSPALRTTLTRWGIQRIGDLAALPASAVGTRLGPEGLALARRARGEDEQPLVPRSAPLQFEESVELDYGIETIEPLTFVLRGLLDRLTARLAVRGLVCGDLRLSLGLTNRARDDRTVVVAASNDVKALLTLVRLHLEAQPPAAPVETIRVGVVPERLRTIQLDLFRPNGPAPERLAVTLARLTALCGADHVGTPAVIDTHRPEAYGVKVATLFGCYVVREEGASSESGLTTNNLTANNLLPLALRAIRPPRPLEVHCDRGRLAFVRGDGVSGRVVSCAGPWRITGEWWHDGAYRRDYYDVQLSDGGVYRVFHDRQQWFVAGEYD